MTLAGRDMAEKWLLATCPYLEGISGDDSAVADLLTGAQGANSLRLDTLMSLAVLKSAPQTSAEGLALLYGDTLHLQREVIEDAHALTAVIDACGKSGHGDLAVALCLRSSAEIDKAWEVARRHHLDVIGALKTAHPAHEGDAVYECQDATLASDIADVLARTGCTRHRCSCMHGRGRPAGSRRDPPMASRPISGRSSGTLPLHAAGTAGGTTPVQGQRSPATSSRHS